MTSAGYITDLDYIPGFYPHMAPTAMRYAASLNRVIPPKTADGFRYLELGCGLGRSLTTLAAANPQGEFIGVDINPSHVESIENDIAAGGLTNVQAITSDFATLSEDIGTFDFLTLHGVFSWVSPEVREQIFTVAKKHLAPGGLLLVSYNAMPGWAHLQPIRGILRQYAALREGDTTQRIRDALNYLVFIRDKKAKYFEDNPGAAAYVDSLLKQDLRYLAHEYLNEHWTSFYFSEVASMFAAAEMSFVGTLPIHTNFWDLCVRPEFQDLFRTTSNTDHIDGLFFRTVRDDLKLPHRINLGVVTSTVQGALYETLLSILSHETLTLSQLVEHKQLTQKTPTEVIGAIDAGVAMGLFEVSANPVPKTTDTSQKESFVPSLFNQSVLKNDLLSGRPVSLASVATGTGHSIGDFDAAILYELNEAGEAGLAERVIARLVESKRSLQKDGEAITDRAVHQEMVEQACDQFIKTALPQLSRLGIVEYKSK